MYEIWLSLRRTFALLRRYAYLIRGSWPRYVEMAYAPVLQVLLWGFITQYLTDLDDRLEHTTGMFLSGVLLWNVLRYGQQGVWVLFTEEMWSRHLAHLFASPLRTGELVTALLLVSIVRILIGAGTAAVLVIPLHHFSIFAALGMTLVVLCLNLLWFSWAIGLILAALSLRLGLSAGMLTSAAVGVFQPLSGVYYPIAILPAWLQPVSWCLPSAPVFEGMRSILFDGVLRTDLLLYSILLNSLWTAAAALVFTSLFNAARRRGLLLQVGE